MTKQEWTSEEFSGLNEDDAWTIDGLYTHLQQLNDGALDKSVAEVQRGVKALPLFNCIPVENILVPPLHNNELFVNHPIQKGLMRWIHHRIEQLPQVLIDARLAHIDLVIQLERAKQFLDAAKAALPFRLSERKALKPRKKNKEFVFEDDNHKLDYETNERLLEEAKVRETHCRKQYNDLNAKVRAAAKKVISIEKKKIHGALSQAVRQRIEELLERVYNIIRSAYHGGDFEGNHCRKFLRKANEVMNSIEGLLLAIPQSDRADGCDDDEIQRCCCAFKRLFQHFDLLVHYCQQPLGSLTDDDMADVRKLVGMLDRLWRRLFQTVPPKAHAWWHLLVDLERLRGLKSHQESKIEVAHQVGKKIDLLFRAVNDINKKIDASLAHQHTMNKASMQMIQATVKEKRSRKRNREEGNDDSNGEHHGRLQTLSLPEIDAFFPTLKELAKIDRMKELDTADNANNSC